MQAERKFVFSKPIASNRMFKELYTDQFQILVNSLTQDVLAVINFVIDHKWF